MTSTGVHGTGIWKVGDVTVQRVVEALRHLPAESMFPESSMETILEHREWLYPEFIDENNELIMTIGSILINDGGTKIIVDTGMGNVVPEAMAGIEVPGSQYLDDLAAAGFEPESVDVVICTHLHVDHVGWNVRKEGDRFVPTFPNARYLFTSEAMTAWRDQVASEVASDGIPESVQVVFDAGLVDEVELSHLVSEHVRLESAPGHTRGHVAVLVEALGKRALITGDLSHHPIQWAVPEWSQISDVSAMQSTATRKSILDKYAGTDVAIIGTHYAGPLIGRLEKVGGVGRFTSSAPVHGVGWA